MDDDDLDELYEDVVDNLQRSLRSDDLDTRLRSRLAPPQPRSCAVVPAIAGVNGVTLTPSAQSLALRRLGQRRARSECAISHRDGLCSLQAGRSSRCN